jgi:hypothetical protein
MNKTLTIFLVVVVAYLLYDKYQSRKVVAQPGGQDVAWPQTLDQQVAAILKQEEL